MSEFGEDMRLLKERLDLAESVPQAAQAIVDMMAKHPDAIAGIAGSYRFAPADGEGAAFRLCGGKVTTLADGEDADVTVGGKQQAMLDVLRGSHNPVKLLVTGKLKIKGDIGLLLKVAKLSG